MSAILVGTSHASDNYYAHFPVMWVDTTTWQEISHTDAVGTVLLVDAATADVWDTEEVARTTQQTSAIVTDLPDSFAGLAAYSSEQGSLRAMQGFLYGISALVTIAFLSVWTLQRFRDIAILRAMGASKRYVVVDELTQSAIDDDTLARSRREEIGIVFQSPNMLASLTVREQLLVTDHIRGLRGRELTARRTRADELLAAVGLPGFGDRKATKLSGGQRQRVNIARALMGSPAVLLADEPTSALDHRLSTEIIELLRNITDEFKLATLLITHDRSQLAIADTVAEMRDGKLTVLD